jgi:glucose-fructose oxidoreductase
MQMTGKFAFVMGSPQWRAEKKLAGGGPLMDLGVYLIQESCMGAGAAPLAVTAHELPKKRPEFFRDVEESIDYTLEFPGGERSNCYTSYNDSHDSFRAEAKGGWFEISPAFGYRGLKASTSLGPVKATPPSQQALQMDDFAQCVIMGRPSIVPGEMGRRDLVIIEAIYASAASGKRAEIKV